MWKDLIIKENTINAVNGGEQRRRRQIVHKLIFARLKRNIKYIALITAILILAVRPASRDRVIFLDVGQGDCCLVQAASGDTYLFDCGSSSRSSVGKYVLLPCLKYYGISELDAVFVSHPDTDHMNGILELLEFAEKNYIEVKQLVLPAVENGAKLEQFGELITAASDNKTESTDGRDDNKSEEKAGEYRRSTIDGVADNVDAGTYKQIRLAYLAAGESWESGNAKFLCLHPERDYSSDNANAYSLCVFTDFGSFRLLLTGDVEGEGEKALTEALAERDISDVTILKVAHHGSRNSTSSEFLEQIQPKVAIISCGENNTYGHPHEETLERLEAVGTSAYRTDQCGAVIVETKNDDVRLRGYVWSK